MAADVDRHRKPGDMGGVLLNVDREGGCVPAEALRANIQRIDTRKHLGFQIRIERILSLIHICFRTTTFLCTRARSMNTA